eukprot:5993714-Amphidinium_carterae.1
MHVATLRCRLQAPSLSTPKWLARTEVVTIFKETSRVVPNDVPDGVKAVPGVFHWQSTETLVLLNLVDMLDDTVPGCHGWQAAFVASSRPGASSSICKNRVVNFARELGLTRSMCQLGRPVTCNRVAVLT